MNKLRYMAPQAQKIQVETTAILAGSAGISNDGYTGDTTTSGGSADQGNAHAPLFNIWDDADKTSGYRD